MSEGGGGKETVKRPPERGESHAEASPTRSPATASRHALDNLTALRAARGGPGTMAALPTLSGNQLALHLAKAEGTAPSLADPRVDAGGNAALARAASTPRRIGKADDPLEHEADRAAAMLSDRSEVGSLDLRESTDDQALGGEGRPSIERALGTDLSGVRVHTGPRADAAAAAVHARAFTAGNDVFLRSEELARGTPNVRTLVAHELAHVAQNARGAPPMLRRRPAPKDATDDDEEEQSLEHPEFDIIVDSWDPTTFWTPPDITRADVAYKLYGDDTHVGGFDAIGPKHFRMRTFDGIEDGSDALMQKAIDEELDKDVGTVVGVLCQRLIGDEDERSLVMMTGKWAHRSDLRDEDGKNYFDRYLDQLDRHSLTESGLFSDTTHPASEWMMIEAEEKIGYIGTLIARRSSRGNVPSPNTGAQIEWADANGGELGSGASVGTYAYRKGDDKIGLRAERLLGAITVVARVADESTATAAEIALRSAASGPRAMIPGGNGHFYGYTIKFPLEGSQYLDSYWFDYPGTIYIAGGEVLPDFAKGGEEEEKQRKSILAKATESGQEALRTLDFDVLSTATVDQRIDIITRALAAPREAQSFTERYSGTTSIDPVDVSLITRVIFTTPREDFPVLERRLATSGLTAQIAGLHEQHGALAVIGRVFTVKAVESMQVPGANLVDLPSFDVGYDEDGAYHYAFISGVDVSSKTVSAKDWKVGEQSAIGHEQALAGEEGGALTRTGVTFLTGHIKGGLGGAAKTLGGGSMVTTDQATVGPFLPTQLVRINVLGDNKQTRIVTALEAGGLLALPEGVFMHETVTPAVDIAMMALTATGLGRVFGTAFAEALVAGEGTTTAFAAMGEAATTRAGGAAIFDAAVAGSMVYVDANRRSLEKTASGRGFLAAYDVAMTIMVTHDLSKLLASGILPKLAELTDKMLASSAGGAERAGFLKFRDEVEAFNRAFKRRWLTPPVGQEIGETTEGLAAAVPGTEAAKDPKFLTLLREARGEVASERLLEKLGTAGRDTERAKSLLDRLGTAAGKDEHVAAARLEIAQRAAKMKPEAGDAFLRKLDELSKQHGIENIADLLTAAAKSPHPNVFLETIEALSKRGLSEESLANLGAKALKKPPKIDLKWLAATKIDDDVLEFLAADSNTNWEVFRQAAVDPGSIENWAKVRAKLRGAAAEWVAGPRAEKLGKNVQRQVPMGGKVIDYGFTVGGVRPAGFEVKGWTPRTAKDAVDAAAKRADIEAGRIKGKLTDDEAKAVEKFDHMVDQLKAAQDTTKQAPYLGLSDKVDAATKAKLQALLQKKGLGKTEIVPLPEEEIKQVAAETIGEGLGIPHPKQGD